MSDDPPHNPLIKRLLRNYQETAERSLQGPARSNDHVCPCDGQLSAEYRRLGITPGLMALSRVRGDPHRRLETSLEGEKISCFVVGGERRLCVPQLLNTVLSRFSLSEINSACDSLRIHITLADDRQLTVLRRDMVLPETAHGCGLMTQSDAQRLCTALLGNYRSTRSSLTADDPHDSIPVMHRCFGKCAGWLRASARLVTCAACHNEFDVEQFVCHSHGHQESRTCHWGFDAANWRLYLQLSPDVADDEGLRDLLEYFKDHVSVSESNARKRRENAAGESVLLDKRRRCDDQSETSWSSPVDCSDERPDDATSRPRLTRYQHNPPTSLTTTHRWTDGVSSSLSETTTTTTTTTTTYRQRTTADMSTDATDCGSVVELLEAEYQLFKSAVYSAAMTTTAAANQNRRHLLDEFICLQQRHAALVASLLRSHAHLQQEVQTLHESVGAKLLAAAAQTESRRRQIDVMRRDDDAKLTAARRENEALRQELDAMIAGAKRTDVGLVKAKYKARAKYFQCKAETMQHCNAQLVSELVSARQALQTRYQASSPASDAAAAGPLPSSPTILTTTDQSTVT